MKEEKTCTQSFAYQIIKLTVVRTIRSVTGKRSRQVSRPQCERARESPERLATPEGCLADGKRKH